MLIQPGAVRRRAAGPRDLRRRGRHPGAARRRRSATSGGRCYRPSNTVVAVAGDLEHDEAVELAAAAVRDRQRRAAGLRAGAGAAGRGARPHRPSATPPRRSSRSRCPRSSATTRTPGPCRVLNVVLGDGMSSRLFLGVREEKGLAYDVSSGIVEYADAGALEISAGVDPAQLPAAIEAILAEVGRMIDEPVPDEVAREGEGVPRGRPGAAHGRLAPPGVVDRRPGGAPRPRVHARRGARGRRGGPARGDHEARGRAVHATTSCGWRWSRPARHLRGLEKHLRLPR